MGATRDDVGDATSILRFLGSPSARFIYKRARRSDFFLSAAFLPRPRQRTSRRRRSFLPAYNTESAFYISSLSISLSYSPLSLSSLSRSIWHRPPSSTPDVSRFGGISMAYRMYARITFANYELSPYTMPVMRLLEAYVIRLSSGENRARKYAGQ